MILEMGISRMSLAPASLRAGMTVLMVRFALQTQWRNRQKLNGSLLVTWLMAILSTLFQNLLR
jgi:hypothetical protein